jgi:hypothetical protein
MRARRAHDQQLERRVERVCTSKATGTPPRGSQNHHVVAAGVILELPSEFPFSPRSGSANGATVLLRAMNVW